MSEEISFISGSKFLKQMLRKLPNTFGGEFYNDCMKKL